MTPTQADRIGEAAKDAPVPLAAALVDDTFASLLALAGASSVTTRERERVVAPRLHNRLRLPRRCDKHSNFWRTRQDSNL
ncbi:MAG: hypothetical protein ACT4N4_07090 [Rhodospirillales bacterium]